MVLALRLHAARHQHQQPQPRRSTTPARSSALFYHTDGNPDGKVGLWLTLFPIDTDRFRLGYLYDISWGGTDAVHQPVHLPAHPGQRAGRQAPVRRRRLEPRSSASRRRQIVQLEQIADAPATSDVEQINIRRPTSASSAAAASTSADYVHLDVGGGYFQQGKFDLPDVRGQSVYTYGGSARLVVHDKDMPVPQSIDFLLYRNDPNKPQVIFAPEVYTPGKTTWLRERRGRRPRPAPEELRRRRRHQGSSRPAAAALQGNLKSGFFRASLTGIYRDLPYVLRNQPSFIPFETLPKDAKTDPRGLRRRGGRLLLRRTRG